MISIPADQKDRLLPNHRAAPALMTVAAATLAAIVCAAPPAWAAVDPFPPAHAASAAPSPALSADDRALVQKATDYIQALRTAQGRFTQTDPKGHATTGALYIQRPGKARFQYDPPAQLLVVADGSNVSVYDRRLKSFDQYPLAQTPLSLLLGDTVRLDRGVQIVAVDHSRDGFTIAARDARRPALGGINLTFSNSPLALRGWTVIDAQGQKTEVRLSAFASRSGLDPKLFVLRDPRPESARP
jgi:outer membrane lipoprotein-sorting protein